MAEAVEKIEELTVPEGGIGDFVMEDDEIEEVYGEKSSDYGDEGIAQFPALAERMAKYGRNEDNMLAHVAEGELIIPAQFLADPAIKERIFDMLIEQGVENPEAYVVGAEANDINPTTGLPEFFLKKLFKKIVKAVKKVVKAVVKVVKKIAPIVLPIAMPFLLPALGPMYGAALGSGIGTLIGGGSLKDALKSALVAGAIGGVTAGFTGPNQGAGSFFKNIGDAANPARLTQGFSNLSEGLTSGSWQGFKDAIATPFDRGVVAPPAGSSTGTTKIIESGDTLSEIAAQNNTTVDALLEANPNITDPNKIYAGSEINIPSTTTAPAAGDAGGAGGAGDAGGAGAGGGTGGTGGATAERGILEKTGDYMFRGGQTPLEVEAAKQAAGQSYLSEMAASGITPTEAGLRAAQAAAGPGMLARFGPTAAVGALTMGATGMFDVPQPEQANFIDYNPDGTPVTGADLIAQDPGKYLVKDLGSQVLNEETGEYEPRETTDMAIMQSDLDPYVAPEIQPFVPSRAFVNDAGYLMSSTPGGPFARPLAAAAGGAIFPRRNGGIMPNEGIPGQDSVRAMLMPGEFVMTTDAVRGAGNGNLNNGIKNMYSVMGSLEARGRA